MIFLGDIPPPLHGMATINKEMLSRLEQQRKVTFINTSPSFLSHYFHSHLWSLIKVIFFFPLTLRLLWALTFQREKTVYRALNGGSGQYFDLFWIWLATCFGAKLYLHHHASLYLTKPTKLFKKICKIAHENTIHIVLGEVMSDALISNYNVSSKHIRILSNAAFFPIDKNALARPKNGKKITIGYLANISFSKGIDVFLETLKNFKHSNMEFEAFIAGPCHDPLITEKLETACIDIPQLKYLGGLYNKDKELFFSSLDYFVYPSRNEAEPLVVYEAAAEGAYILSSEAGCMKASTQRLQGWSLPLESSETWAKAAANHLTHLELQVNAISRHERKDNFQLFAAEARENLSSLIKELSHAKT